MKFPISRFFSSLIACSLFLYFGIKLADAIQKHINFVISYSIILVCSIVLLLLILNTDLIVFYGELTEDQLKKSNDKRKRDIGLFEYDLIGFKYENISIKWNDIQRIIVVIENNFASDRIHLILENEDKIFNVSEDDKGWYIFIEKLGSALSISQLKMKIISASIKDGSVVIWER